MPRRAYAGAHRSACGDMRGACCAAVLWPCAAWGALRHEEVGEGKVRPVLRYASGDTGIHTAIDAAHPGSAGNKYGYEDGVVRKVDGAYHLFVSEEVGDPEWVKMRLAHWRSSDGTEWARVSTLFESSGNFDGTDPRACLWSPVAFWNASDGKEGRWYLTYVSYRAAPNNASGWYHNYDGQVWLAKSRTAGRGGVGGPYDNVGVILHREDGHAQQWEGLQGDDSFFAFTPASGGLVAFYGSGDTGLGPEPTAWRVGLAESESGGIGGPWRRRTGNPVVMNGNKTENPIVEHVPSPAGRGGGGAYIAVFDDLSTGGQTDGFAYSWSADGLTWAPAEHVSLPGGCRAPLGLVHEGGDAMSLWYTCGRVGGPTVSPQCVNGSAYDALYRATLRVEWKAA